MNGAANMTPVNTNGNVSQQKPFISQDVVNELTGKKSMHLLFMSIFGVGNLQQFVFVFVLHK